MSSLCGFFHCFAMKTLSFYRGSEILGTFCLCFLTIYIREVKEENALLQVIVLKVLSRLGEERLLYRG